MSLDGVMKSVLNEVAQGDATTSSLEVEYRYSTASKISVQVSQNGNQSKQCKIQVCGSEQEVRVFLHTFSANYLKWKSTATIAARHVSDLDLSDLEEPSLPVYETWANRWIAYPIICLFPAERREEWIGDLYEIRNNLLDQDYPRWLVNGVIVARTGLLIASALKVWLIDLIAAGFLQNP